MRGLRMWRMRHLPRAIMIAWRTMRPDRGSLRPLIETPPFAAPLRCALTSGETPREGAFGQPKPVYMENSL